MRRFIILTAIFAVMCVATGHAAIETIIVTCTGWVADNATLNQPTVDFYAELFPDATIIYGDYGNTGSTAVQEALLGADLLVVPRTNYSSDYTTDDDTWWNENLKIPIIVHSSYFTRSSKLDWESGEQNGGTSIDGAETTVTAEGAAIFGSAGIFDWWSGTGNFDALGTGTVGDGKILATMGGNNVAVGWEAGDTNARGTTMLGNRLLFNVNVNGGGLPDTEAGLTALKNVVKYYCGVADAPTAPHDPIPENGAASVGMVNVPELTVTDVDLMFKAGQDPNFANNGLLVNPNIDHFNIRFQTGAPDDPNLYVIDALDEAGQSATDPNRIFYLSDYVPGDGTLKQGTTYQWQVEQVMINPVTSLAYSDGDPNNIFGRVWAFTTSNAIPTITAGTPYHTLTDFNGNGMLQVQASATANNYQWFKVVGDQDTEENAQNDDILLTDGEIDGVTYSDTGTATLVISGMASNGLEDAQYYVIAYNGIPGSDTAVESLPSEIAWVWYPREVNRFTFEGIYVADSNSYTPDSISSFDAELMSADTGKDLASIDPNNPNAPGLVGTHSLYFNNPGTGDPNEVDGQYAQINEPMFGAYADITIAAWIYNRGGSWARVLSIGNNNGSGTGGDSLYFTPTGNANVGQLMLNVNGQSVTAPAGSVPENEWAYVAATLSGNTAKLYVNGEFVAVNENFTNDPIANSPTANNWIGRSQWFAYDPLFNGYIADLRIWNYGLTNEEVGKAYLADSGAPYVCEMQSYALAYDFNGNCLVDLGDFAIFAETWLDSYRLYPE